MRCALPLVLLGLAGCGRTGIEWVSGGGGGDSFAVVETEGDADDADAWSAGDGGDEGLDTNEGPDTKGDDDGDDGDDDSDSDSGWIPDLGDPGQLCELPCGQHCCDPGQICEAEACVPDWCRDDEDCAAGQTCDRVAAPPAEPLADECRRPREPGVCVDDPPSCDDAGDPDCANGCYAQPVLDPSPSEAASWTGANVMNLPVLVQLDDDDCDGQIDRHDVPDFVVPSFEGTWTRDGTLHAFTIIDGQIEQKWSVYTDTHQVHPGIPIAAGDLDGQPGAEIVACTDTKRLRAFGSDGTPLWLSEVNEDEQEQESCFMPNLADLDGDGLPEVVTDRHVYDGQTGAVLASFAGSVPAFGSVVVADLDLDDIPELVGAAQIFAPDGTLLADTGLFAHYQAVADLDDDGLPEIVSVSNDKDLDVRVLHVWRYAPEAPDGYELLRTELDINGPHAQELCNKGGGGGPPTIADFDGDGDLDVGLSGRVAYSVFDGHALVDPQLSPEQTLIWAQLTADCSSGVGGVGVFDLDGDGAPETAHMDHEYFSLRKGLNGERWWRTCNTNGTLWEFPLIADVDGDGAAEIIVSANDYHEDYVCPDDQSTQRGLRIYEASLGEWMPTSSSWNQHAFSISNVDEAGAIPAQAPHHWLDPDTRGYRHPFEPGPDLRAPDLRLRSTTVSCDEGYAVALELENAGLASVPAGVVVELRAGAADGALITKAVTAQAITPGHSITLELATESAPMAVLDGETPIHVALDTKLDEHLWRECERENNAVLASGACP